MRKHIFYALFALFWALSTVFADPLGGLLQPPVMSGSGAPEGAVTGTVGTVYRRLDGGVSTTFYVKESGTGNTGWVAYGSPSGTGAPATATYITRTADGGLDAEFALGTLSSGLLRVETGNGNLTAITDSAGVRANISDESGTGAMLFAGGDIGAGTATTPAANDNDTSIPTTAYVQTELAALAGDALINAAGFNLNLTTADDTFQELAQKFDDFVAPTGDSATGFFPAGQIERARGGTGADTSAYGVGLFGSDGSNNTIDVDTADELSTAIAGQTSGTGSFARVGSPTFTTQITSPVVVWTGTVRDLSGAGSPEGSITAPIGSVYRRTDGGAATVLYIKESGAGNTGWVAYGAPSGSGAPTTVNYLVGSADGTLSDEIVVGLTPGGELGGSWASPTIDDSLSVTNWTLVTPTISGAMVFPDGVRQTFNPDGTNAGINVGSQAGNPSSPSDGDMWYNSTGGTFMARINGANVSLGAGGGTGDVTAASNFGTDNVLIKSDGTSKGVQATGISVDDSNNISGVTSLDVTTANTESFKILDNVDQSHGVSIVANENLTADINLNLNLSGATRSLAIPGNATISGTNTGDQTITLTSDVTGGGTGTFATTIAGDAVTFAKMANLATDRIIGRDTAGTGDPEALEVTGGLEFTGAGGIQRSALTGDVAASAGSNTTTIQANSVALGTDTTGNYMTDVAATAGETSVSHTPSEGSTATIGLAAAIDLGSKTSFEIPNGAAPTVDAFGEIAGDNNLWAASRGAPVFFDGTASVALVGALVSDVPTNGQVPKWKTGGVIEWEDDSQAVGGAIENEAFGAAWNGDTTNGAAKDNLYDYLHLGDTDDDGLANVLDAISAAGFPYANSGGVIQGSRTVAEGLAIDVTNSDGASGNPTVAFDPTELTGSRTWGDASTDTIVWTFNRATGTDPTITFSDGSIGFQAITLATPLAASSGGTGVNALGTGVATALGVNTNATGGFTTVDGTATLQNKDLTNANNTLPCEFIIACSDLTTALTTGTTKAYFRAPYAFTVTSVSASVLTAPTGAILIVDINDGGTTIMTTNKLSIDATELTSATAATAPGLTDTAIAADAVVAIDIDQIGSTVAGAGLIVTIQGTR